MKIENQQIARYFNLRDDKFYTTHILNKHTEIPIANQSDKEFRIVFCDGTSYESSDFGAHIIEDSKDGLQVHFCREDIKLNILYTAREDVIAKEVTIIRSDKTINYVDVEVLEFANKEGIFYPKKQENIKEMADFPGYYVELGQPVYAKTLYLGMEFPMGENRITDTHYFSRYYVGPNLTEPKNI